jgi:diguanylate cyclase (GGDEF)-like protein
VRGFLESFARLPRSFVVALAFGLVAAVRALDAIPGSTVSFSVLHFVPVFLGAWFVGSGAGVLLSVAAAAMWLWADLARPGLHGTNPALDAVVRLGLFLLATFALRALRETLEFARTDRLTGLPNRRAFYDLAAVEMERSRRYQHPFTVAYLDMDRFKDVNERFGPHAGDAVLRAVGLTLRKVLRASDVVARVGDDEFAVLFPETGAEPARSTLDKLRSHLQGAVESGHWQLGFSIGAVTYTRPPDTTEAIMNRAHGVMRAAKTESGSLRHEVVAGQMPDSEGR